MVIVFGRIHAIQPQGHPSKMHFNQEYAEPLKFEPAGQPGHLAQKSEEIWGLGWKIPRRIASSVEIEHSQQSNYA